MIPTKEADNECWVMSCLLKPRDYILKIIFNSLNCRLLLTFKYLKRRTNRDWCLPLTSSAVTFPETLYLSKLKAFSLLDRFYWLCLNNLTCSTGHGNNSGWVRVFLVKTKNQNHANIQAWRSPGKILKMAEIWSHLKMWENIEICQFKLLPV